MFGKEKKEFRIRKTTNPKKISNGTEETYTHYLTFLRNGMRITVTKFLPTGEVHLLLSKGSEGYAGYKEIKRLKLQVPSKHQIDVAVAILIRDANAFAQASAVK